MWDADDDTQHHHESGLGCWPAAVCTGSGTFENIIGTFQFFCTQEQHDTAASMDAPYGWNPKPEKHLSEFRAACAQDSDCPYDNHRCWRMFYESTEDGKAFGNGVTCDHDIPVENRNYAQTDGFFYFQYEGMSPDSEYMGAMTIAATTTTVIAMMMLI